jgi:PEP-CTERM motif
MKKQLLATALVALTAVSTFAQGTIQLNNSVGTPVRIDVNGNGLYETVAGTDRQATAADGLTVQVWWGSGAELSLAPAGATVGANGVLVGNNLAGFQIEGSQASQVVSLQIRAQNSDRTLYGETKIAQVTLGPSGGPGTVIWQGPTGTLTTRFTPLLVNIVPEPSTIALGVLGLSSLLLFRRRK